MICASGAAAASWSWRNRTTRNNARTRFMTADGSLDKQLMETEATRAGGARRSVRSRAGRISVPARACRFVDGDCHLRKIHSTTNRNADPDPPGLTVSLLESSLIAFLPLIPRRPATSRVARSRPDTDLGNECPPHATMHRRPTTSSTAIAPPARSSALAAFDRSRMRHAHNPRSPVLCVPESPIENHRTVARQLRPMQGVQFAAKVSYR